MKKFINVSNHPSSKWTPEQMAAALTLGSEVSDLPFPNVPPAADEAMIATMADEVAAKITDDAVVMVSGEFTLTYAVVKRLRARNITVVAATTDRVKKETAPDKFEMVFVFKKFRSFE